MQKNITIDIDIIDAESLYVFQVVERAALLCSCYGILEHVIEYLTLGPSLSISQPQILQLHSAMQGAFAAVIYYLSSICSEHKDQVM